MPPPRCPLVPSRVPAKPHRVIGRDAEVQALTEGGMDPRHDHLNAELELDVMWRFPNPNETGSDARADRWCLTNDTGCYHA
jgi:hypothetical protein